MRQRKTSQIVVRLTEQDREKYDREAEREGLDTSSFVRMTLRRALAAREAQSGVQVAA